MMLDLVRTDFLEGSCFAHSFLVVGLFQIFVLI